MNAIRLIGFFVRKFLMKGISAGIDHAYGANKNPKDMTAEERRQNKAARQNAKRTKRTARLMRRVGRF